MNGINIDRTQGVDPHAVYFPGTATAMSYGLQIGRVTCASVSDGAHVVSLKYAKNFTIGELVGHTDVGSALTVLECTGSVGIVELEEVSQVSPKELMIRRKNKQERISQLASGTFGLGRKIRMFSSNDSLAPN